MEKRQKGAAFFLFLAFCSQFLLKRYPLILWITASPSLSELIPLAEAERQERKRVSERGSWKSA
ncbi:hypothetical protein [Salmonella enterica]|uniref:hypothetical protein n=1 Tax=Salmonella enterica TaxID=28901 RepID=UPI002ED1ACA0|nr:hypothetical protein SM154_023880 [Salmonella enterica subsp. enterica serovar Newport str. DC_10-446]